MLMWNAFMTMISLGLLLSLRWMRSPFRLLEKIVYYMVAVTAIEQLHSIIPDNGKLFKITESGAAFLFFKLSQLIVFPIVTLWLLYALFYFKSRYFMKILLSAGWLLALTGAYWLYEQLGVISFTGWKIRHALVMWSAVLAASAIFCLWFRTLLRKSENRDAVSS